MVPFKEIRDSLLHLVFPNTCPGCGISIQGKDVGLCMPCMRSMPETNYHTAGNPVERKLLGRLSYVAATAQYYFSGDSMIQQLLHRVKYGHHKELALYLGQLMGAALKRSGKIGRASCRERVWMSVG